MFALFEWQFVRLSLIFEIIFRGFVTIFMVFVTIFRVVSAKTRKPFPSSTDTGYIWLTA